MNKKNPKIIFFGTPEFAAGILRTLVENGFDVVAVVTQPDKKVGRKQAVVFSPVKKLATERRIKVFQPVDLKDAEVIRGLQETRADLFVVAAYGKILPKEILEIPEFGAVNVHASLLPKFRGASPVQCAILTGEKETGITLMQMNEKMDEGEILVQEKIEIEKDETADELLGKLGKLGAEMMAEFVPDWIRGKIKPIPQDSRKATLCRPVRREDGRISWNSTVGEIYRKWRAYHPWPGIFAIYKTKRSPKRLKLAKIETVSCAAIGEKPGKVIKYNQDVAVQAGKGLIILKKVQLEGKREMEIGEFLRGDVEFIGNILE